MPSRRLMLVTNRPFSYGGPAAVRWDYMTEHLPEHGWQVEVVTSRSNPTREDLSDDPRVARLAAARARVMRTVGRLARPMTTAAGFQPEAFPPNMLWSLTARRMLRERARELAPDVIVATSPPPSALFAVAGALTGSGVPLVADLRDPWAGHPLYDAGGSLLRRLEGSALDHFDAIVAVTDTMAERLGDMHPGARRRLRTLPNGFDPTLLSLRADTSGDRTIGERAKLIHPGVLYGGRVLDGLLSGIERAGLAKAARVELIGNVDECARRALAQSPDDLEIDAAGPRPWQETMTRVADADIVVVIVPAGMGDDVAWPVKVFEALALGKPILAITSGGATEALLDDLGLGVGCARDGDPDSIAQALRRLLDDPPDPVAPERLARWDRSVVARDYAALLDRLADQAAATRSAAS